jgi:hypothetical protein
VFGLLAGMEEHSVVPLWSYADGPGMYWYQIWFLFGDFEFSLDLCSLGILDPLSSECFGGTSVMLCGSKGTLEVGGG